MTVGDLKTCSPHDSWILHSINHWTWNISLLLYFTHWKWLHWTTESWLSPASQPRPPSCSYYAPEGSVGNCTTVYFKCRYPIMWWSLYFSIIKKSPVFWISCWFELLKLWRAGLVQAVESYRLWPEGPGFESQSPHIAQARVRLATNTLPQTPHRAGALCTGYALFFWTFETIIFLTNSLKLNMLYIQCNVF